MDHASSFLADLELLHGHHSPLSQKSDDDDENVGALSLSKPAQALKVRLVAEEPRVDDAPSTVRLIGQRSDLLRSEVSETECLRALRGNSSALVNCAQGAVKKKWRRRRCSALQLAQYVAR